MGFWKGFNTRIGVAKATTWGTPVEASTGKRIDIETESLVPDAQLIDNNSLVGGPFRAPGDLGNEFHAGDLVVRADYDTIHSLLAFAMGTAGVPSTTSTGGIGAFLHTLRFANSLEGIFTTLAIGGSTSSTTPFVREYTTVKHNGFSLSINSGDPLLQMTFPLIPHGLNMNTSTGVNTFTTVNNISFSTAAGQQFATFNHLATGRVQLNDSTSGALSTSDDLYVTGMTLDVDGNFPSDDVTTRYAPKVDEPIRDGFVVVNGEFQLSKINTSERIAKSLSKLEQKAIAIFDGGLTQSTGSTGNYLIRIYLSNLILAGGAGFNIGGPGRVPETLPFQAHVATAAHTGFPNADALTIQVQNRINTDPLA